MWYFDRDSVLGLARWLHSEGHWDGAGGVKNLIYFFEKPWKYDNEWSGYQKALIREKEEQDAKKTRV